ncbi:MAG: SDR family NAD(P)-dependent oxidoreductase [Lachnospiraceae bacterium]|nr:SDR family NAD(P)-dependent oxidoreductase [Lachnospiraceae bacterium]
MKIAIVTGASSGMGREFVLKLENYITVDEIWVIARGKDMLESLNGKTKAPIKIITLDLTQEASYVEYNNLLSKATPDVSLLINCAGFGNFGSHENIPLNDSLNMINLNCRALVAVTELTLPYMSKGSKIIQLDSLSAFQPVPYMTVYGATKAFVLSYSRAMNKELMSRGIRMMSVNPGWVKTEFFNTATKTNDSKVNYYNKLYEASDVVDTALKDLYKTKKDVSIHGFPVRMQVRLVKLLPHSLIMKIWLKQQQKSKNSDKLTI